LGEQNTKLRSEERKERRKKETKNIYSYIRQLPKQKSYSSLRHLTKQNTKLKKDQHLLIHSSVAK
jgi:hypothetical protein